MAAFGHQVPSKTGKKNKALTGDNELIEDYTDGKMSLDGLDKNSLPGELKGLSKKEQKAKLGALVKERQAFNGKMDQRLT